MRSDLIGKPDLRPEKNLQKASKNLQSVKSNAIPAKYFQKKPFKDKGNKFNAKTQNYNGFKYDSKKEAAYAMELDWRIKAGELLSYEKQYKIDLKVNGLHICNYYCDFKVINKYGGVEFHEVKGLELPLWQLKWKILQATLNEIEPGAELIVIK